MSTNPTVVSTPRKPIEPHALDAGTPVLFLPVYLETQFIDLRGGGSELWVRIYPDQISINAHEQELTKREIDDGQAYWNSLWSLGKSAAPEDRRVPWRDLASKYGAQRAAWIARQMTPANLAQQPAAAATATLTLTFGSSAITFRCSRSGAAGNRVQIAVDTSAPRETPVSVAGNLVTIYAKWDGTLHTTREIATFFPSTQTDDGGTVTASVTGTPQPLRTTVATNLSGGRDPSPAPAFPSPPTRASSWEKPAMVEALPDSWKVILISGTQKTTVQSKNPIKLDLATTMDPQGGALPPGSPVNAGLRWLVSFDAAMDAGMALKVPLTAQQRSSGFDRLIVYGLRSRDERGADTLADLLDAHHYTDGFSLVPQGSPTNNTSDGSSAYSRKDPDYATSFAVEGSGPLIQGPQSQPDADGNRFAGMLGIDASRMQNVQHVERAGVRNGSDMLTVVWPSTLGYFLAQLMTPGFPADLMEAAQDYALSHAVPRGPIPAFRVGRTPYGVLPVTALSRYKLTNADGATPIEELIAKTVRQLWHIWLQSATHAPHLQRGGDTDTQLSLVLGMDASASSFRARPVLGSEFLWNYMDFEGMTAAEKTNWTTEHDRRGRQLLDALGFHSWDPRAIHLSCAHDSFPVVLPRVQAGVLSETDPLASDAILGNDVRGSLLTGNYIQWLAQASIQDIRAENYPGPRPTALLYQILRMSTILEYGKIASNAEIAAGRLTFGQVREQELVGMGKIQGGGVANASDEPVGVWDVLRRPSIPDPSVSWSEYLDHLAPSTGGAYVELNHFRASLRNVSHLPTAELDRLLTETLDSCSHRLDVWATAIATAMLRRTRQNRDVGTHLASYGWLEDLRPSAKGSPLEGTELKLIEKLDSLRSKRGAKDAPPPALQPQADNGGFIYAPSQDQAAVAAILRSGYMSHQGTGDQDALSIDLSSERVRGALMLLDGVRQGQSLNALLGYLFEGGLHELNLQKYIQPFRDRYPMAANQVTASRAATAAVSNVVDGMALKNAWDKHQLDAGGNWGPGLPSASQPQDQAAVVGLLREIDGYADSLADLSIAETLYQTVRGNFERGGGLLAAVSRGAQIPDPGVITTRRAGLDITHRAGLLFAGAPLANAWNSAPTRARALGEPWLDAWLSQILPDPSLLSCSCSVSHHDETLGDQRVTVQISQLGLAPLDCIAMAEGSTNESQRSEIEYRILYVAGIPPTADPNSITITYTPTDADTLSIPDLLYLWKTLRLLIFGARPMTPQDFVLPAKKVADGDGSIKLADLQARAKAALKKMEKDLADLSDSVSGASHPEKLPERLWTCSFYGVPGSVPFSNTPGDARLARQAAQISSALADRYTKAASLVNNPTATAADLKSALAQMFGKEFMVLPPFTLSSSNLQAVQNAFQQSDALVASDPVAPMRWLTQLSYVRPAIARLDAAFAAAEICGESSVTLPALKLGQLPVQANDRWLGLPWTPDKPPSNGRLAFACFTVGEPTAQTSFAGLLVDEWLDRIPLPEEKAALAFHYDEPSASPPHALLLGVCPDQRKYWDDDLVSALLEETLELAKIRTVDLHSIQQVGQILPALYFPLNLRGAAPSAHFFSRAGGV